MFAGLKQYTRANTYFKGAHAAGSSLQCIAECISSKALLSELVSDKFGLGEYLMAQLAGINPETEPLPWCCGPVEIVCHA